MKHVEASIKGKAWKEWYILLAMIRYKHVEGELASEDLLHNIGVG